MLRGRNSQPSDRGQVLETAIKTVASGPQIIEKPSRL